jgi:uncharacterized repeat protein (TIGR02543 family)
MKIISGPSRHHYLARVGIFLVTVALIVGMGGCNGAVSYTLTITSTSGGSVAEPGEGTFTYDEGTVVNLVAAVAETEPAYDFVGWTGDVNTIADVSAAATTITMNDHYSITANFALPIEIRDWCDLDAARDNLSGSYILMNELDSTTPGYEEMAGPTANGGKGWKPIEPVDIQGDWFTGSFDGQGYEIKDLFINCSSDINDLGAYNVGLFGLVDEGGIVKNVRVSNATVSGISNVGGLAGFNDGTVSNSYFSGNVTGDRRVGGLVGWNSDTVSNSCATGSVNGDSMLGALVGYNERGTVSNSHYNYDEVLINGQSMITIGALFGDDFEEWLANDKFLDIDDRLAQEDSYYLVNNVTDFKELLAFGQDASLKYRLTNDLDLATELGLYIPYLAGEFDGNGHIISNLRFNSSFMSHVGLFGYLAPGGKVSRMGVESVNITGDSTVGALVGINDDGTVSTSYSSGNVTGNEKIGGLVGSNYGAVSDCYSLATATGGVEAGGLVGIHYWLGSLNRSYCAGNVTGDEHIGGLVGCSYPPPPSSASTYAVVPNNCFWDIETSGQTTSDGGTGMTTAEMKSIATFSGAGWNIITVGGPGERNPAYIWNIVNNVTYPFLSWQS